MQLTVCAETVFTERPLAERFAAIRESGIDGVELWGVPQARTEIVHDGLHAAGCRLEIFSGNRDHSLIDAGERAEFLAELKANIATATRLGCPRLMLLSDKIDSRGIPIPPSRKLSNDEMTESMVAGLRKAAELAEAASISLVIEPLNTTVDHPGYALAHSAPAFEIVRQVGNPRLKVLYDVYHMQIMEGNLIATIEANLDLIGHIHVADVPGRHEPGTGEINYANIARMLRANGYEGCVGLECVPLGDSRDAVKSFCERVCQLASCETRAVVPTSIAGLEKQPWECRQQRPDKDRADHE
jgi:hydroxypyruvate isomerase